MMSGGSPLITGVGSSAVRDAIAKYQPMLSLHGHIHESRGEATDRPVARAQPGQRVQRGRAARGHHHAVGEEGRPWLPTCRRLSGPGDAAARSRCSVPRGSGPATRGTTTPGGSAGCSPPRAGPCVTGGYGGLMAAVAARRRGGRRPHGRAADAGVAAPDARRQPRRAALERQTTHSGSRTCWPPGSRSRCPAASARSPRPPAVWAAAQTEPARPALVLVGPAWRRLAGRVRAASWSSTTGTSPCPCMVDDVEAAIPAVRRLLEAPTPALGARG